jgi:hypothetical protein
MWQSLYRLEIERARVLRGQREDWEVQREEWEVQGEDWKVQREDI